MAVGLLGELEVTVFPRRARPILRLDLRALTDEQRNALRDRVLLRLLVKRILGEDLPVLPAVLAGKEGFLLDVACTAVVSVWDQLQGAKA